MENNQEKSNIRENLLKIINAKEVSQRPKYFFTLKIISLVAVSISITLISIFIFNFILFGLRLNHQGDLLGFGARGIGTFLHFFPWSLFLIDIILILILQKLVRHFKFGYRFPYLYLLISILVCSALVGLGLDRSTGLNEHFLREVEEHGSFFPINTIYSRAKRPFYPGEGVCKCKVISIEGNSLTVLDTRSGSSTLTVLVNDKDDQEVLSQIRVGDVVLIAGDEEDGEINAYGIKKISSDDFDYASMPKDED